MADVTMEIVIFFMVCGGISYKSFGDDVAAKKSLQSFNHLLNGEPIEDEIYGY